MRGPPPCSPGAVAELEGRAGATSSAEQGEHDAGAAGSNVHTFVVVVKYT